MHSLITVRLISASVKVKKTLAHVNYISIYAYATIGELMGAFNTYSIIEKLSFRFFFYLRIWMEVPTNPRIYSILFPICLFSNMFIKQSNYEVNVFINIKQANILSL